MDTGIRAKVVTWTERTDRLGQLQNRPNFVIPKLDRQDKTLRGLSIVRLPEF